MSRRLSKQEAIALFPTAKALAAALGISKAAVSQWPDGLIPENHDLKIRYELLPERFGNPAAGAAPTAAKERTDSDERQRGT